MDAIIIDKDTSNNNRLYYASNKSRYDIDNRFLILLLFSYFFFLF